MPPEAAWFDEIDEDMQRYTDAIMIFLRTAGIHDDAYELTWLLNFPSYLFPNYKELVQYYEPITNACDSAIYVLTYPECFLNIIFHTFVFYWLIKFWCKNFQFKVYYYLNMNICILIFL